MYKTTIELDTIEDVKDFVNIVNKYDYKIDLITSRYTVDAKSLMGIFSLELSKPIEMKIYSDNYKSLIEELKEYILQ